jgi:hypothetical protein
MDHVPILISLLPLNFVARHPVEACVRKCCRGSLQNARRSAATSVGFLYQGAMREALIEQGLDCLWEGARQTARTLPLPANL